MMSRGRPHRLSFILRTNNCERCGDLAATMVGTVGATLWCWAVRKQVPAASHRQGSDWVTDEHRLENRHVISPH